MASASVSVAGNLPLLACLGSVGRIRANGPVAAHPNRRMRQIPFRVVPKLHFDSKRYPPIRAGVPGTFPESRSSKSGQPRGTAIFPELRQNVYGGKAEHAEPSACARAAARIQRHRAGPREAQGETTSTKHWSLEDKCLDRNGLDRELPTVLHF